MCARTGAFKKAEKYLLTALKSCPPQRAVPLLNNLAFSLQLNSQIDEAEKVYLRALELDDTSFQVLNNIGNLYRQKGEFKTAEDYFDRCVVANPSFATAFNNQALCFIAQKKFLEAARSLDRALEIDPNLDSARSNKLKLAAVAASQPSWVPSNTSIIAETDNDIAPGPASDGDGAAAAGDDAVSVDAGIGE
jgi:Tfp pilus assembly protein PilF